MGNESDAQQLAEAINIGRSLYGQERYQDAVPYFTRVIDADPSITAAWASRGISYLFLHEFELALHDVAHALTLLESPSDEEDLNMRFTLLYSRALALDGLHRSAEALAAFKAAATVSRLPEDAFVRWGDLARLAGQREEAVSAYHQAINNSTPSVISSDTYLDVAQSLMELGDFATALGATQMVVQQFPENIAGWKTRARAHLGLGQYHASLDSAEHALTLDGQDYYAWGVKGAALQGLKRYREAQEAYHHSYTLVFTSPQKRALAFRGDLQMLLRTGQLRAAWQLVNMEMGQRLLERQIHRESGTS